MHEDVIVDSLVIGFNKTLVDIYSDNTFYLKSMVELSLRVSN